MRIGHAGWAMALPLLGAAGIAAVPAIDRTIPLVARLLACRTVAEPGARLACYDREVGALAQAASAREVVILDRDQVTETKRSLFGFAFPRLPWFAGAKEGDAAKADRPAKAGHSEGAIDQLDSVVNTVSRNREGRWIIVLEDGARWEQIESAREAYDPRPGMPISIQKASLGSYFAKIGPYIRLRVRRIG